MRLHRHRAADAMLALLLLVCGTWSLARTRAQQGPRPDTPNILLLVIGDLSTDISGYTSPSNPLTDGTYTPNIRWLVDNGLTFDRAYSNLPRSSPARNSLMTGLTPVRLQVFNDRSIAQSPSWSRDEVTFMQPFLQLDPTTGSTRYTTMASGTVMALESQTKRFLNLDDYDNLSKRKQDPVAPQNNLCNDATNLYPGVPFWNSCERQDETELVDNLVAYKAIQFLRDMVRKPGQPFFMSIGTYRPHMSFSFPTWAAEQMQAKSNAIADQITDAMLQQPNPNTNGWPLFSPVNPTTTTAQPPGSVSRDQSRHIKFSHAVSTQWADFTIGKILDEMRGFQMLEKTVIVLTSDTSISMGERSDVGDAAVFENVARVPLVVRVPWLPRTFGRRSAALVELVDVYPTLFDLVAPPGYRGGVDDALPAGKDKLSGQSFAPVIQAIGSPQTVAEVGSETNVGRLSIRAAAYTIVPRCTPGDTPFQGWSSGRRYTGPWNACQQQSDPMRVDMIGLSVRTDRWRYTEWRETDTTRFGRMVVVWDNDGLWGRELYDHKDDDGLVNTNTAEFEMQNLAPCPSCFPIVPQAGRRRLLRTQSADVEGPINPPDMDAVQGAERKYAVRQLSLALRTHIELDWEPGQCSFHGLENPDQPGKCDCYSPGWSGPGCTNTRVTALSGATTRSPVASPTTLSPPPVGAPTFPPGGGGGGVGGGGGTSPPVITSGAGPTPTRPTPRPSPFPTREPIEAPPTLPWPDLPPPPTGRPTQKPIAPTPDCGTGSYSRCQRLNRWCYWENGFGCRRKFQPPPPVDGPDTVTPTAQPTFTLIAAGGTDAGGGGAGGDGNGGANARRTCSDIGKAACQRISGCLWTGTARGCRDGNPAPCGCPESLNPVTGFVKGLLSMFRTRCVAECKGASDIVDPDDEDGDDGDGDGGTGTSEPDVPGLDLYMVVDMGQTISEFDATCIRKYSKTCWEMVVDNLLDRMHRQVAPHAGGYYLAASPERGLRYSILAFSCDGSNPITVPVLPPTGDTNAIAAALRRMKEDMAPSGGKCPEQAIEMVYADMLNAPAARKNKAMVLFSTRFFAQNGRKAVSGARKIRKIGAGTYTVSVAKRQTRFGGLTVPNIKELHEQMARVRSFSCFSLQTARAGMATRSALWAHHLATQLVIHKNTHVNRLPGLGGGAFPRAIGTAIWASKYPCSSTRFLAWSTGRTRSTTNTRQWSPGVQQFSHYSFCQYAAPCSGLPRTRAARALTLATSFRSCRA